MGIFSPPKAPSQKALDAASEASARKERDKLASDQAAKDNQALRAREGELSKRMAFASGLTPEEDVTQRKRFLKGA